MQTSHVAAITMLMMLGSTQFAMAGEQVRDHSVLLQDRMSYSQFRKLGLDQLSTDQLAGLNAWLKTHGNCGPELSSTLPPGKSESPRAQVRPNRFQNRIAGDFTGWDQGTVLKLQNGQRWRVTDDERMHVATMHNPKVTLWKGFLNSWLLSVDGLDRTVHVAPVG